MCSSIENFTFFFFEILSITALNQDLSNCSANYFIFININRSKFTVTKMGSINFDIFKLFILILMYLTYIVICRSLPFIEPLYTEWTGEVPTSNEDEDMQVSSCFYQSHSSYSWNKFFHNFVWILVLEIVCILILFFFY